MGGFRPVAVIDICRPDDKWVGLGREHDRRTIEQVSQLLERSVLQALP